MTISAAIAQWLALYKNAEIDTNHVAEGSDKFGLYKSPNRETRGYSDGSYLITEHYQLLVRQSSVSELDRKDSDEFLENLIYWADDYEFKYQYPELDKGRKIIRIEASGSPYPINTAAADTLYQILLRVEYTREREEL